MRPRTGTWGLGGDLAEGIANSAQESIARTEADIQEAMQEVSASQPQEGQSAEVSASQPQEGQSAEVTSEGAAAEEGEWLSWAGSEWQAR